MLKYNKYLIIILVGFQLFFSGCGEDNYKLGDLITPTNLDITYEVVGVDAENPYGDGSGAVNFSATATDYITFNFQFGDGKDGKIKQDGKVTHVFSKNGVNTYNVTVLAVGTGGITTSKTIQVEVFSSFTDDEALLFLTGGSSKTWYWAADQPGHTGLGPNFEDPGKTYAAWYNAAPFEKECMYGAEFVFTKTSDGMTFEQTAGVAFIPGTYAGKIGVGPDACYGEDVVPSIYGVKNVSFSPSSSIATEAGGYRGTTMTFSNGGFMSWYVGKSVYEIIQVTNNLLKVRVEEDGTFAWHHTFTSIKPGSGEELDVEYNNLVWADEFDVSGSPSATNWAYDLGTGNNGWGNGEVQYYTNRTDNVTVADGILKITAKKENYEGSNYTSARIKSQGLYDFKYGRVDVKAKLPTGGGTWPAIWMLGSNITTAGWPACGEIDIMESAGNNPGVVSGAIHTPSSYGATVNIKNKPLSTASSEFHVYSVNWSAKQVTFLVDDEIFYTYNPEVKDGNTWPFDASMFLIFNVAMGGTFGGNIDSNFTQSSMEIDWVRVYQ